MKVSVVTPSFNQGEFLERTILSVLNQDYPDIEYIVIDACSTDSTKDLIEKYRSQIDIIIVEPDDGQSDAIQKGFNLASGDLVGWLNSDDVLLPGAISRVVEAVAQRPDVNLVSFRTIQAIGRDDTFLGLLTNPVTTRDRLLNRNFSVNQQGSFYRRSVLLEVGGIQRSIQYCMDLDLFLRILRKGPALSIDGEPGAAFRFWEGTKTSVGQQRFIKEISDCLGRNGMKRWSANSRRLTLWSMKLALKKLMLRVQK